MGLFGPSRKALQREIAELRANIESPSVPISSPNIMAFLGLTSMSSAGETVTIESALGVPSVWAAVNFLAGTMAEMPLHVYRNGPRGRERATGAIQSLMHDAVNDGMSSFAWRQYMFTQVFTRGRGVSFIERSASGRPINIWPLDIRYLTVIRRGGQVMYRYEGDGLRATYEASEVIDIPFMLKADGLGHLSPILSNANTIGLAQAVSKYGAEFFANGGVPPFTIEGPITTPGGLQRAADDLAAAVEKAAAQRRKALALPAGHKITPLGFDAEKMQMIETHRFLVEQVARIYSLPPTFLQDLSHGTFSNTEQQDLHFTKHTLNRWIKQFEQEVNLKLFGRASSRVFVEMNLDGLLRGDFKTRMDGYAQAINSGLMTPNEARRRENLPDMPGGDTLLVQGAMVPMTGAGRDAGADGTGETDDDQ